MMYYAFIPWFMFSGLFFFPNGGMRKQETATLVIYRRADFGNSTFNIKANGELIVSGFRKKAYFTVELPAGSLTLETSGGIFVEKKEFGLTVDAGQTYYLEAVVDYDFLTNALYLFSRSEVMAQKDMQKLKKHEQ